MDNILSIDPAINNLAMVNLNISNERKIKINYTKLINLKENLKKIAKFEDVIKELIKELNSINLGHINKILIENPPALKNPQLKTIAISIYIYFIMKGCNVSLVSPTKKLSKEENKTKNYKQKKQASIDKCLSLLDEVDKKTIKEYTKQDDIADCICQAYEWVKKNIPKINISKSSNKEDNSLIEIVKMPELEENKN